MGPQRQRFRILGAESANELTPQQTAGTKLGHLHEEVHPDAPEERQPRRERVDVQAGVEAGLEVVDTVGECVGEFEIGCGTGLLDVVAGNRDGVELRHVRAGVGEDIGDDPHRGLRRIDVGIADHELFEDVVLDGPGEFLRRHALLLGGHHIQREDGQHRAIHCHRHRYRRQVDPVEQFAHVQDRVDGHPGHPNVALHPGMVGVIAAVGRQVEGHRQTFLPGRQIPPVEGVGVRRGGEPRVLADGPRLVDVHRRIGPADERRCAGNAVGRVTGGHQRLPVRADVKGLDDDAFRGGPVELFCGVAVRGRRRSHLGGGLGRRGRGCGSGSAQGDVGEAGHGGAGGHLMPPIG